MQAKRSTRGNDNPGPGTYETKGLKPKPVSMGSKLKKKEAEDLPGPGNYVQPSKLGEGPHYSMYDRRDEKYNDNPGPGSYEALQNKIKGLTMGGKLRDRDPEELPGPGNYEISSRIVEGPQYSMGDRQDQKISDTPGPGTYEAKGLKAKGVSMGAKLKEREKEELPGPGNYEQRSKLGEGPHYSMYDKRETKYNDNPGPGAYEASEEKRRPVTMGTKLRDKAPEELPGPGNYEQRSKI